jgi:serine/threonine-protein kinase
VHDRGVIHLDLKPENIMVGSYGQVMVMDWGSARLFDEKPYQEYQRTHTGHTDWPALEKERVNLVMGTPLYMSPEQTNTPRDLLTPGSDIFSAGVVLYEMLSGRRPFMADSAEEVMAQVRGFNPVSVHDINSDVPRRLSAICTKMLEKQPFQRYQSFHEVLADLEELRSAGAAFPVRTFVAGETIVKEGEEGDFAFAILSGHVDVSMIVDGQKRLLAKVGPGEIIGELAVFTTHARTATVTALEPTTIRILREVDVKRELEKMSPWVGAMIRGLSERFIDVNERLARSK